MTEAMAEQQKTNDPETNPLGVPAWFIAQNRDHGQEHHRQRRNRNEESVPMIRDREGGRDNAKHDHDAEGTVTEKSGSTGEFAITKDTQNRDRQNRPGCPKQDRAEQQWRDYRPGNNALHQFLMQLVAGASASVQQPNDDGRDQKCGDDCDRDPERYWRIERVPKSEESLACDWIHLNDVAASR